MTQSRACPAPLGAGHGKGTALDNSRPRRWPMTPNSRRLTHVLVEYLYRRNIRLPGKFPRHGFVR